MCRGSPFVQPALRFFSLRTSLFTVIATNWQIRCRLSPAFGSLLLGSPGQTAAVLGAWHINDNSRKALIHLLNICIGGLVNAAGLCSLALLPDKVSPLGISVQFPLLISLFFFFVFYAHACAGSWIQALTPSGHRTLDNGHSDIRTFGKHCSDMLAKIYDWRMSKA